MDIKILDSHLREHLETKAKPLDIAKALSLTSASIERVEPFGKNDFVYSVEVTTNRADMASVIGLAREAAVVLPEFGFDAKLLPLRMADVKKEGKDVLPLHITVDKTLTRRVCCVILDVTKKDSPQYIQERLEAAGIRSLNNLVDVTNYVMLEVGHPAHVFDYDRLKNQTLIIRESKKGEKIVTLDKKEHTLPGGDIVADNGEGEIIDLLGIMGTANSVVTDTTKRILFFFDNNDPWRMRRSSMGLGIRTDAASLNEKGVDPELAMTALLRGVLLYKDIADATVASDITDIYPDKPKSKTIRVTLHHINTVIGVDVSGHQAVKILTALGFGVQKEDSTLIVTVPSWREGDVSIPEDIVEEVARLYGYHNIPTQLPPFTSHSFYHVGDNQFFWESRIKDALKYWGLTEVYTYSMVSETLFEGPLDEAVTLNNPLDSDHVHMRKTLTPSLLGVIAENKAREHVSIFELANVYSKVKGIKLPVETRTLGFVLKGKMGNFSHAKGIIEQILHELGIKNAQFTDSDLGGIGASIVVEKKHVGTVEVMDSRLITAELDFEKLLSFASLKKTYRPLAKYPPVEEDMSFVLGDKIKTGDVIEEVLSVSKLIASVALTDMFENSRTFHIVYQDKEKNLTTEETGEIRKEIIFLVEKKFKGKVK